ncbi:MAG: hypothetical protein M1608_12010 [Candidatus Omnitrophica bacterium]|nr:hypothetical protein [Candidatus Omnitrophota bacterium]
MKKALCLAPLLGLVSTFAHAQLPPPPSSDVTQSVSILQRHPHDRVWQAIKSGTDAEGNPMVWTNMFTELCTGVCRFESNRWVDASEQIETFPEAFVARQGQHQAVFSTNLNIVGAIDLLAPDGQRLRSTPVALRYFDRASGKSVLIATLKDSQGELADVNRVLYPDAFEGVRAGVRMTYTLAGLEQDILLEQSPPNPEKLGLSSDSTMLQVMTEFYSPPTPEKTERTIRRIGEWPLVDQTLRFGAMRTGPSRAFVLSKGGEQDDDLIEAVHWEEDSGRFFLVESIEFPLIKSWLDALPPSASLPAPQRADAGDKKSEAHSTASLVSGQRSSAAIPIPVGTHALPNLVSTLSAPPLVFPSRPPSGEPIADVLFAEATPGSGQVKMALSKSTSLPQQPSQKTAYHPAVVLDFTELLTDTNRTLLSDTTYCVSRAVNLSGTTTIEGGTVVKYANTNSPRIYVFGPVNCKTSAYRPAVFTAKDDDTVGEPMGSGSSPSGYYADTALYFESDNDLKYLRVSHAQKGIYCANGSGTNTLTHAQFANCDKAFYFGGSTYNLRNILLYRNNYGFYGSYFSGHCENLTFDQCGYLGYETVLTSDFLWLTNSLLVQITNGCNFSYSSSYCGSNSSSAAAFQTVAGVGHYPAIADWRNAGTTSINAGLLADLRKKTTYPPIVWSGDISSDTILAPQALRDDDPPDLGYHYDPLDWVFHDISLSSAQLILTNGVAIGVYGTPGINLLSGAKLYSEGSPTNLNRIVRYQTVLEQQPTGWTNSSPPMGLLTVNADYATLPEARFRFTDFSQMTDTATRLYILYNSWVYPMSVLSFTDCQLRGGRLYYIPNGSVNDMRGMTLSFTNNLFQRFGLRLAQGYNNDQTGVGLNMRNNLFYRGAALLADYIGTFSWAIYDNQFDSVDMTNSTVLPGTMNYNGFINTPILGGTDGPLLLTNFVYTTGPLGDYYQSSTDMVDEGSRGADDGGLYHYTTRTTQSEETDSQVDIGLHYVALNGQNLPVDTDADGLPDYFENRDGDGNHDATETNPSDTDTDYDGRNDAQEYADGTDPLDAASMESARMAWFRFNTGDWKGEQGESPLQYFNVANVSSFDGNALQVNSASAANLKYRDIEPNGKANINCRQGSVRFLFKPSWSSQTAGGSGPGSTARLVEMGISTTPPTTGWWCLSLSSNGNQIYFSGQTNGASANYLTGTINWTNNFWYEIILTYTSNRSLLYINGPTNPNGQTGLLQTNMGSGVSYWPNAAVRSSYGFSIGSDKDGNQRAQGQFDEFETYNYPIGLDKGNLIPGESKWPSNMVAVFDKAAKFSAVVTNSPPTITLQWRNHPSTPLTLKRRVLGTTNWTTLATDTVAWHYTNTSVSVGTLYEYLLEDRWLIAAINAPPMHDRGRVILLVDQILASQLTTELAQLKEDLVGDGWRVIQHTVPRHDDTDWSANPPNIAEIKATVVNDYNTYSNEVKSLFIIGHVAYPLSGRISPDGHEARVWPTDGYYADIDGNWTDTNSVPDNVPGDGKFDQDAYPSPIELSFGRVDFANMPAFSSASEIDLIKRYLSKNHRYRTGQLAFPARTTVMGCLGGALELVNKNIYINAGRNATALFGEEPSRNLEGNCFKEMKSYLWGFVAGAGEPERQAIDDEGPNRHTTMNLANPTEETPIGFFMPFGSYFGEWPWEDDFLRACIGTLNSGLGSVWGVAERFRFEPLGLGDSIGTCVLRTLNDTEGTVFNTRDICLELMGDPTLRMQLVSPAQSLSATQNGQSVTLSWTPSTNAYAQYYVYRSSNGLDGPFIKLTDNPVCTSAYTDANPPAGAKMYQVRAALLNNTGSGSFTNLSQGVFKAID